MDLTIEDYKNIILLINAAPIKGVDAEPVVLLKQKIQRAARELAEPRKDEEG